MSISALTRAQVRRVDRIAIEQWGIPSLVLMENAGRGVADVMCRLDADGSVVVVCAKGNNAGDGFVLARHLCLRGVRVEVVATCPSSELAGDASANYAWLTHCRVPVHQLDAAGGARALAEILASADWIVDALLGTGAVGDPRAPLDHVIETMNAATGKRLAIDVPSGLDCDTGHASAPTFRADHTCTFVAPKIGFANPASQPYVGKIHVLDIGLPQELVCRGLEQFT